MSERGSEISSASWEVIAVEVERLVAVAARHELGADLRWRVRALERAVAGRNAELLPLALGATGRAPPPAVEAWSYDGVTEVDELAEVAVWHIADAAVELVEGAGVEALTGARAVLGAWEARD